MAHARLGCRGGLTVATRLSDTSHEALGLIPGDLLAMYRTMLTARLVDEAAFRLNRQGKAPFVVPVSGHEGCQIGTAWALERGRDVWLPYYRDLGVVLVAGMTPYEVFLGLFAKADDPTSGGRQMPAHWSSRRLGIISGSSPIGTQIPHASGIAYAVKYRGEDAVVASWFGEGATSEGDWHEGLNFAGIHRLPVVFICENNRYAISVEQSKQMAVENVAVARARSGGGPTLIECKTYRFQPHTSDDDDRTYRSREEVEKARLHDPVSRFATYLTERGLARDEEIASMAQEVKAELDVSIDKAWNAADPDPATLTRHVFREEP